MDGVEIGRLPEATWWWLALKKPYHKSRLLRLNGKTGISFHVTASRAEPRRNKTSYKAPRRKRGKSESFVTCRRVAGGGLRRKITAGRSLCQPPRSSGRLFCGRFVFTFHRRWRRRGCVGVDPCFLPLTRRTQRAATTASVPHYTNKALFCTLCKCDNVASEERKAFCALRTHTFLIPVAIINGRRSLALQNAMFLREFG